MKKILRISALFVCISSALLISAQTKKETRKKGKPTIAVLPFSTSNMLNIQNGNVQITAQRVETEFSNMITEFLVKSRKFNVLDRNQIRRVIAENNLTESDWVASNEWKKIGNLLVADYLVVGQIDRNDISAEQRFIAITGETKPEIIATFKTQYRIIKVDTGSIVFAQQIIEKVKDKEIREKIPIDERKDWTLRDYQDYLLQKVSRIAGNKILEGIYPVRIIAVNENSVMLNRGDGSGVVKGTEYKIYKQGEAVKDPDTGEVLGTNETVIGTIEITDTFPKYSKGKIKNKTENVPKGSICRKVSEDNNSDQKAPDQPRVQPGW